MAAPSLETIRALLRNGAAIGRETLNSIPQSSIDAVLYKYRGAGGTSDDMIPNIIKYLRSLLQLHSESFGPADDFDEESVSDYVAWRMLDLEPDLLCSD